MKNKKIYLFCSTVLLLLVALGMGIFASEGQTKLITTRGEFLTAITSAKDGDTLLVGDIDFRLDGTGAVNDAARIMIDKDITIKSGKPGGEKAIFLGGSIILKGKEIAGEKRTFNFENIVFDGNIEQAQIDASDWLLSYDSQNEPISPSPLKAQYAVSFAGGATDANFAGCRFTGYMAQFGGAVQAYYAGVSFRLNCSFTRCMFDGNTAQYYGGAMYLEGSNDAKNVHVDLNDCDFKNNVCGLNTANYGGGAIYAGNCVLNMSRCNFTENASNFRFINHGSVSSDVTQGGAIFLNNAAVNATLCSFKKNKASLGGAIGTQGQANLIFDGCIFSENSAISNDDEALLGKFESNYGRMSGKCIGGAMYIQNYCVVSLTNTSVYNNVAQNVSGGIHIVYSESSVGFAAVDMKFCSVVNNVCNTDIQTYKTDGIWKDYTYPYDIFAIKGVTAKGCFVADALYAEDIFNKYQAPDADNGFNYYASSARAKADGVLSEAAPSENALHIYAKKSEQIDVTIPTEFVKQAFGGKHDAYIGEFHVGSNCNPSVTLLLNSDDKVAEQPEYKYGVPAELPALAKKWHTFDGWFTEDGKQFSAVNFAFAPSIGTFTFTAKYTDVFPYGNVIGGSATVNADGTVTIVANAAPAGQVFKGWQINGEIVSTESEYTFDAPEDISVAAVYENIITNSTVASTTVSPVNPPSDPSAGLGEGFSNGVIVAIVLSCVCICSLALFAVWYFAKNKKLPMAEPAMAEPKPEEKEKSLPDTSALTEREKQVLELLLQGKKRSEIGAALFVSEETIKKQITSIYGKLGVSSRSELFALFK